MVRARARGAHRGGGREDSAARDGGAVVNICASGGGRLDRRAAVRRSQCREEPGLVLRRDRRRDPERADAAAGASRGRPHVRVHVPRSRRRSARHRREAGRRDRASGQRAARWRSHPRHRAARGRRQWLPALVRSLRSRAEGHLRRSGRNRPNGGCTTEGHVDWWRGRAARCEGDGQPRVLRAAPQGAHSAPQAWCGDPRGPNQLRAGCGARSRILPRRMRCSAIRIGCSACTASHRRWR